MTHQELRDAVSKHIDEYRDAYNETGDERYRAVKNELLHVLGLIDAVDGKPVGKDKLTLEELAQELRKIFIFKYLIAHKSGVELFIVMYVTRPEFITQYKIWDRGKPAAPCPIAASEDLRCDIDLSEYKDENGEIDYSKCIVEVTDASE